MFFKQAKAFFIFTGVAFDNMTGYHFVSEHTQSVFVVDVFMLAVNNYIYTADPTTLY